MICHYVNLSVKHPGKSELIRYQDDVGYCDLPSGCYRSLRDS